MTQDFIDDLQIINSQFSTYPARIEDAITKMVFNIGVDLSSDVKLIEGLIPTGQGLLFTIKVDINKPLTVVTLTRNFDICRETSVFIGFVQIMKDYLYKIYTGTKSR